MIEKTLPVKARDNRGNEYEAKLVFHEMSSGEVYDTVTGKMIHIPVNKWVLEVPGTPGRWFVSALLEDGGASIYIDRHKQWSIINLQLLVKELKLLI